MKTIRYLLFVSVFAIAGSASGQGTLRISPNALDSLRATTFMLGDSFITNGADSFGIWVYNTGSTAFADTLSFAYNVTGNGVSANYSTSAFNGSGISFSPRSVTILAHDSVLLYAMRVYFTSPVFTIGSSTVVIWPYPYHTNPVIADSASLAVTITQPAGIGGAGLEDIQVYMAGSTLMIRNDGKNLPGRIRIYNSLGELIEEQPLSAYVAIPMEAYTAGIYYTEVILNDNEGRAYKVFNAGVR